MKKYLFTLIAIAFLISCKKDSDIATPHTVTIINNSGQNVKLMEFDATTPTSLDSTDKFQFTYSVIGNTDKEVGLFTNLGDSLKITYNDTLNVYHGSKRYNVARDARNVNFYVHMISSLSDTHFYTYTLTNTDFNEAVMIGDSL